jgi:predicted peroxiredoxin
VNVKLILVDGGVHAAQKGQNISGTEYQSIEDEIKDCINMGVEVYADRVSLRDEGLEPQELIEEVNVIGGSEIAEILSSTDVTMIF